MVDGGVEVVRPEQGEQDVRMAAEASAISHLWDASAQQSSAERIARGASFQITSQGSADPLHRAQSLRV